MSRHRERNHARHYYCKWPIFQKKKGTSTHQHSYNTLTTDRRSIMKWPSAHPLACHIFQRHDKRTAARGDARSAAAEIWASICADDGRIKARRRKGKKSQSARVTSWREEQNRCCYSELECEQVSVQPEKHQGEMTHIHTHTYTQDQHGWNC